MSRVIPISALVIFFVFCSGCVSEPKYYDPTEIKGLGVIVVDAEYTTYREVTRTRERYVPGVYSATSGGSVSGTSGHTETEYYTTTEAVKYDNRLPFIILTNGVETFRGTTPVRVTNFDPGVTYTIIWNTKNGTRKEGTFVITTQKPFTRYIHLE
jgi:hypothetical protein